MVLLAAASFFQNADSAGLSKILCRISLSLRIWLMFSSRSLFFFQHQLTYCRTWRQFLGSSWMRKQTCFSNARVAQSWHLCWNQIPSVLCLLQICGYCFVICLVRADLRIPKKPSLGSCPPGCRSMWCPSRYWIRSWVHNLCTEWNWPVGQTPANGDAALFLGHGDETGKEGNIAGGGEEQEDERPEWSMRRSDMTSKTKDDCFAQTSLHAASTWATRMRSYVWSVPWEKCARVVRCDIQSFRRVLGGLPSKRETVKEYQLWEKTLTRRPERSLMAPVCSTGSRSFIDAILCSRFHQSSSSQGSFCHSFDWCWSL